MPSAYRRQPDVLELLVENSSANKLTIQTLAMPWGTDSTRYCYFAGVLFGIDCGPAVESKPYYERMAVNWEENTVVKLTPKVETNQFIVVPSIAKYSLSLNDFLRSTKGWTMICEFDCDQQPVEHVGTNLDLTLTRVSEMLEYCDGQHQSCPTFVACSEE